MGKDSLGLDNVGLGCLARVHWCRSESRHGRTVRPPRLTKSRVWVMAPRNSLPPSARRLLRHGGEQSLKSFTYGPPFCPKMVKRLSVSEGLYQGHSGGTVGYYPWSLLGSSPLDPLYRLALHARYGPPLWQILDLSLVHWWSCHQHPAVYLLQMFSSLSNSLSLWFDITTTRTDIGKARKKNVCEDEQRTADPANRGNTRGAYQGAAQGLRAVCLHQSSPHQPGVVVSKWGWVRTILVTAASCRHLPWCGAVQE